MGANYRTMSIGELPEELNPVMRVPRLRWASMRAADMARRFRAERVRGLRPEAAAKAGAKPWTAAGVIDVAKRLGGDGGPDVDWRATPDMFVPDNAGPVAEVCCTPDRRVSIRVRGWPDVNQAMVALGTALGAMDGFSCVTPSDLEELDDPDGEYGLMDTVIGIWGDPFGHGDGASGFDADRTYGRTSDALWYGRRFAVAVLEPDGGAETRAAVIDDRKEFARLCREAVRDCDGMFGKDRLGRLNALAPIVASATDHALYGGMGLLRDDHLYEGRDDGAVALIGTLAGFDTEGHWSGTGAGPFEVDMIALYLRDAEKAVIDGDARACRDAVGNLWKMLGGVEGPAGWPGETGR